MPLDRFPASRAFAASVLFCVPSLAAFPGAALDPAPPLQGPDEERIIEWVVLTPSEISSEAGSVVEILRDGSIRVHEASSGVERIRLSVATDLEVLSGLRFEVFANPEFPGGGPGLADNGNFVLNELRLSSRGSRGAKLTERALVRASADFSQNGWGVSGAVDGDPKSGWAVQPRFGQDHTAIFETRELVRSNGGMELEVEVEFGHRNRYLPGHFRLSATGDPDPTRSSRQARVDPKLQTAIDDAVARGVQSLLHEQGLDGSWHDFQDEYAGGATSLCVYTLLQSGLRPDHPSVRRGLEYLRTHPPTRTYELATLMMALGATHDAELEPWLAELSDLMQSWKRSGGYGYPDRDIDVSCTQYAALGLRAAAKAGLEVPEKFWSELAEDALTFQEKLAAGEREGVAGFAYKPGGPITGSRTVAGLTILTIAAEQLKGHSELSRPLQQSLERGIRWIERYFSASSNPRDDSGGRWTYYYLYGVERLGALTDSAYIGGNDWYRDGARYLLSQQKPEGHWGTAYGEKHANTCFALLFLTKATAPSSGRRSSRLQAFGGSDPERAISLRGTAGGELVVWIDSFGDAVKERFTFAQSEGGGLRVANVEYLLLDQPVLPDARGGPRAWRWRDREPRDGWTALDFEDGFWDEGPAAFGFEGTPEAFVRTPWTSERIWLRQRFDYDPSAFHEPRLVWNLSADAPRAEPSPTAPLLCLFDERAGLATQLDRQGGAQLHETGEDPERGRRAIVVTPRQAEKANVPGWSFEIAKKPAEGQYRYLRFAWCKPSGDSGIMLQFARDGGWGDKTMRYHAGPNEVGFEPSIQLAKKVPRKWTVETRDLYEDFGAGRITGIALTAMSGGEARFDGLYLARSKRDLSDLPEYEAERVVEATSAGELGEPPALCQAYVNGKPILWGREPTAGYVVADALRPLDEVLQPGPNVLAVVASAPPGGQSIDIGMRGARVLAREAVDPGQRRVDMRFGQQLAIERPGTYRVVCRAELVAPPGDAEPGSRHWFESEPLELELLECEDPTLLQYAGDAARNLLAEQRPKVRASSFVHDKWQGGRVVDGRLTSGWIASDHDTAPWIEIDLAKPVRARELVLSHAVGRGGEARSTRAWRVRMISNGRGAGELVEMDLDPERKTVIDLGKARTLRGLRLEIVERAFVDEAKPGCGFAEVELRP